MHGPYHWDPHDCKKPKQPVPLIRHYGGRAGLRGFFPSDAPRLRACLKIAFCKIPSQFASDFMLDLGGVVGYIDEIQHIIRCKVERKIVGMNFQTRSSIYAFVKRQNQWVKLSLTQSYDMV